MKINRDELKVALEKVFPALTQNNLGKEPTFVFSGKYIIAHNGVIGVAYPFETDFEAELPSEEFYKVISLNSLKKFNMDKVGDNIRIKGEGLHVEIMTLPFRTNIEFINEIKKAVKDKASLPKDIQDAFRLCLFSVFQKNGIAALQCLSIEKGYVLSTDSYRISRHSIDKKFPKVLIPSIAIESILKYNIDQYYISDDKIYFLGDGTIICSQLVLADFPKCHSYFDNFDQKKQIKIPDDIQSYLDMVSIFSSGEESEKKIDKQIKITIEKDRWVLEGRNEYGWIKKEIMTDKNSVSISFSINPFFFKQAIDKAVLLFYSKDSILLKNDRFEHIIASSQGAE